MTTKLAVAFFLCLPGAGYTHHVYENLGMDTDIKGK